MPKPCEYIGPWVPALGTAMNPEGAVLSITYCRALSICGPYGPRPGLEPLAMKARPARLVTAMLPR